MKTLVQYINEARYGNLVSQSFLTISKEEETAIVDHITAQVEKVFGSLNLKKTVKKNTVKFKGVEGHMIELDFVLDEPINCVSYVDKSKIHFEGIRFSIHKGGDIYFDEPSKIETIYKDPEMAAHAARTTQAQPGTEAPESSWGISMKALGQQTEYRKRTPLAISWKNYSPHEYGTGLEDIDFSMNLRNLAKEINL